MAPQRKSIKSHKKTDRLASTTGKKASQQPAPLSIIYLRISDLPLLDFIACCVDGDFSALVIKGNPSKEELQANWSKILEQYQTAIGDTNHRIFVGALREVHLIDLQIKVTILCIDTLRLAPDEFFIKQLKLRDRPCIKAKFDWEDQEAYNETLDKALSRVNGLKLDLEVKRSKFEALVNKDNKDNPKSKMDRESFIANLITLSGTGFPIQAKDITTFEYCERLRRHAAMVEAQNKRYR